ncbi:MAG: hypothetical protein D4R64_05740 [Porphyromonadaceae bacterium]|nr:MAG: hypothetical protein D4R64_05740 [Porphyromonadaceae bacterium]
MLDYTRSGFNSGFDYYYLRMRAGLAELNRNNPVRAVAHFRKALDFNQNDPNALEYLYSSLLFSGDLAESRLLASAFSPAFRKRLGIPARRLITSAFIETGYMLNSKADSLKAFRPDAELAHVYLVPAYWYLSAGVNLEAGKRFSATVATNILSFTAIQQFLIQNQAAQVYNVPYDQRAVYLAGSYYLGKGFHLSLAGQVMSYTLPLYSWVAVDTSGEFVQDVYSYRDLAFNASVVKRFPYVTIGLETDINRFKNQWHKQAGAELTMYTAGNVNTYLQMGGTWLSDSLNPAGRIIAHATAGRKLFRLVWIEGVYYYGDIRNFSESNAYVVYNNYDMIRKRMGINLLAYQVLPHLDLSLRYQYTLRSASWQIYQNSEYLEDFNKDYPVHSFIGGLTWRF